MNFVWGNNVMSIRYRYIALALCASCSAGPGDPSVGEQSTAHKNAEFEVIAAPQRQGEVMPPEKPKPGTLDARLQGFVDSSRADLAEKLDVSEDEVELVEARYVTWRDSSLGCPQPGYEYLQALVNGTRIQLRHAGTVYHYHGGKNKAPALCEKPDSKSPLPYGSGDA